MTGFFQHSDRAFAFVLIVLASIFYALIGGMQEPYSPGAFSASTYPRLILVCIIVLSSLLIVRPVSGEQGAGAVSMKGLTIILLSAGYIFLIEPVGFFLLTPLFLLLVPLVAGYRHFAAITFSAIAVTAVLYAVFVMVLNIPLPAGLLGD